MEENIAASGNNPKGVSQWVEPTSEQMAWVLRGSCLPWGSLSEAQKAITG